MILRITAGVVILLIGFGYLKLWRHRDRLDQLAGLSTILLAILVLIDAFLPENPFLLPIVALIVFSSITAIMGFWQAFRHRPGR